MTKHTCKEGGLDQLSSMLPKVIEVKEYSGLGASSCIFQGCTGTAKKFPRSLLEALKDADVGPNV